MNIRKTYLTKAWFNASLFLLAVTFTACERTIEVAPVASMEATTAAEAKAGKTTIYYGPAKSIGKGVARTWVEVSRDGKPATIGIKFSAKTISIEALPSEQAMYHLKFPEQVSIPPYKGMMFDWNPQGHIPLDRYSNPHFDFHFYMIPEMEHMAIPLEIGHPHSDEFATNYMPADYKSLMLAIPGMGNHWVSKTAPEEIGEGFSKTLILGAYQDKQIFIEPMITLEYLQSLKANESVVDPVSQFPKVQQSGYYPQKYTITYDPIPGEYKIALTDFIYRVAE